MGRHVAEGRKRGIAGWPLLVLGIIVVLVAGTIAYFAVLRKDEAANPGACTGSVTLPLLASAGASPAARALSDAFNATSPAARSICLTTTVTSMPTATAAEALIAHWKGRSEPAPGVWLTDDGSALLSVDAQASDLTAGRDSEPLATSPVVLALRKDDAATVGELKWADLPAELGPAGSARSADRAPVPLLLSDPRTNRASGYAAESMLAEGGKAVTVAQAEAGAGALKALRSDGADQPTTGDALDQLATGSAPGAVPVTEADLAAFNAGNDAPLTAVYPSGPTAGDQLFAVALSADWVTPTLRDAAGRFTAFTRSPQGTSVLSAAHFRVPGAHVSAGSGVETGTVVTPLPPADPGVDAALAAALGMPGSAPPVSADPSPAGSTAGMSPGSSAPGTSVPGSTSGTPQGVLPPPSTADSPTAGSRTPATSTARSTTVGSRTAGASASGSASRTPRSTRTSPPPATTPNANVTLLVDTAASWAAVIEGKSRIQWLQEGLTNVANRAGNVGIGLWSTSSTVAADGFAQLVSTGPLAATIGGGQRKAVLHQAIDRLTAAGAKRFYAATPAVMGAAAPAATVKTPGRVILVTDGADQTPGLPRATVTANIAAVTAANPHLQLIVIGVGDAAPADALTAMAAAGNGTYTHVDTKDLPAALVAAVAAATG